MFRREIIIGVVFLALAAYCYEIPDPSLETLKPRGFRVSIPDEPGVKFVGFHANVNSPIEVNQQGTISGEILRPQNNHWIFEDKNVVLKSTDNLHYWIYVQANSNPYTRVGNKSIATMDRVQTSASSNCEKSITMARGKMSPCRDRLIFEETFNKEIFTTDSTVTSDSSWTREILLPLDPDYEFCMYRELPNSLRFDNDTMEIVPLMLDEVYGDNITLFGRLDLADLCTSTLPLECNRRAIGHSILPPVISARLVTRESFHFRYGKIEVRAKFPKGDWLYPELWLEPKHHTNGIGYSNGRIMLGLVRGNELLTKVSNSKTWQYGSATLEFGLRTGPNNKIREDKITVKQSSGAWNDEFHVYTTIWNEEGFKFQVDGEDVGRLAPLPGGWLNSSDEVADKSGKRNNMAPYNNEFYITVGLGVGGIRVFPDESMSGRYAKPWRNVEAKATFNFWQTRQLWLPSWRGRNAAPDGNFKLDYIKVWTV